MGTKRIGNEAQRVLSQNKQGAYSVTLPILHVRDLGWRKGQKITVKRQGNKLIIEDWKP